MQAERRFGGIIRLYGAEAFEVFQKSHCMVVGVGGVGSWAAEALVRSGIGRITLIDMDHVAESNMNRQLTALESNLGKAKISVLEERFLLINPDLKCHLVDDFLQSDNILELMSNKPDFVVDAIDSVKDKAALADYCVRARIPFILSGGAGGQIDPTLIRIEDLSKVIQDPLAAKVRERLRREYGFAKGGAKMGVPCVYSSEALKYPDRCESSEPTHGLNCAQGFGASMAVTASFGMAAASFALKKLSKF